MVLNLAITISIKNYLYFEEVKDVLKNETVITGLKGDSLEIGN